MENLGCSWSFNAVRAACIFRENKIARPESFSLHWLSFGMIMLANSTSVFSVCVIYLGIGYLQPFQTMRDNSPNKFSSSCSMRFIGSRKKTQVS